MHEFLVVYLYLINLILFRGHTALHKAAMSKQRAISCMLVAAGASLTLSDKDRLTPRNCAEQAGDNDLAIYLESQSQLMVTN